MSVGKIRTRLRKTYSIDHVLLKRLVDDVDIDWKRHDLSRNFGQRTLWSMCNEPNQKFELAKIKSVANYLGIEASILMRRSSSGLSDEVNGLFPSGLSGFILNLTPEDLYSSACSALYSLSLKFDQTGDYARAAILCEALIALTTNLEQKRRAQIRLAAILDHDHRAKDGLKILEELEATMREEKALLGEQFDTRTFEWCQYQTGVLLLSLGSPEPAEAIFEELLDSSSEHRRAAASHQLGVVWMGFGRFDDAIALFEQVLALRSGGSYRQAFEHRRIGEACLFAGCAEAGYPPTALKHRLTGGCEEGALKRRITKGLSAYTEALRIVEKTSFTRYLAEIRRSLDQFGLDTDSLKAATASLDRSTS